jgi:hypothetical protein
VLSRLKLSFISIKKSPIDAYVTSPNDRLSLHACGHDGPLEAVVHIARDHICKNPSGRWDICIHHIMSFW